MTDDAAPSGDNFPASTERMPHVAILMCTYNGATYLREQLDSFVAQTFSNWSLYVSDDASTDQTHEILAEYQRRWGNDRLTVFKGPCRGFAANFIALVQRAELNADYFAFSDQDDVWFSDKLSRSVNCLEAFGDHTPALYCSRTRLINARHQVTGLSPLFEKPPSFRNALVQSLAGANTMLINQAARDRVLHLSEDVPVVAHDWLMYLLVTGSGGQVIYDAAPSLDYRQHGANLIGANTSARDRIMRIHKMLSGRFMRWNDSNLSILHRLEHLLTDENRYVLNCFENCRRSGVLKRIKAFRDAGVYRQTAQGNLSLFVAVCLRRL